MATFYRLACVLVVVLLAFRGEAQGVATVLLGGMTARKILSDFEGVANRLLNNAGNSGDALAAKFGDQLRVATRNAEIAMAGQQDKLFADLRTEEQALFTELNKIVQAANNATSRAATMAEIASLDLVEFTNRLPFTEKVPFFVSSIHGITQPYAETDYELDIRGLGFGFNDASRTYRVRVKVNGRDLPATSMTRSDRATLHVKIPNEYLARLYQDQAISFAPALFESEITTKKKKWLVFDDTQKQTYTVPFSLILLPKFPGVLTGTEPLEATVLDPTVYTTSVTHHTQDCHTDRPCDWNQTVALANDEFAVGVRYTCTGQCGWDYNLRGGGYAPDYDIVNNGHKVVVYRHNDGENSTTVTHYIDYRKEKKVTNPGPIGPVHLAFGRPVTIDLSPSNSSCAYQLHGKLVTKQSVYIDNGMAQTPDGLLVRTSAAKFGDHCRVVFVLNRP